MRRALLIVAVVTGYCLLETALLLIYLLPEELAFNSGLRHSVLGFTQFVTIPAMAALFSLFLYGRYQWKRRVALYFITVPGFFTLILLMTLPVALIEWAFNKWGVDPGDSVPFAVAGFLYPIIILAVVSSLLFLTNKEARKRSVVLESSRWLAERQAGVGSRERQWRRRGIVWSLWIPSLTVLIVALFLPEMWGVFTHIQQPRAGQLPGYQVPIPATWVILFRNIDSANGSWVHGIAGQGMGFSATPYLHADCPLSDWDVRTKPFRELRDPSGERWILKKYRAAGQRPFSAGGTNLSCQEYLPADSKTARIVGASPAYIECTSPSGLYAGFTGEKLHLPAFYKMLAGITKTD